MPSSNQAKDWQLVVFIDLHFWGLSAVSTQRKGGGGGGRAVESATSAISYTCHIQCLGWRKNCHWRWVSYLFLILYILPNQEALPQFPANCQRTQNCHTSLYSPLQSSTSSSVLVSYFLFAGSIGWIYLTLGLHTWCILQLACWLTQF